MAGYPQGGDSLSITKGIVSRVVMTRYAHSSNKLLGIQIDAAINPGNSVRSGSRLHWAERSSHSQDQRIQAKDQRRFSIESDCFIAACTHAVDVSGRACWLQWL